MYFIQSGLLGSHIIRKSALHFMLNKLAKTKKVIDLQHYK